MLKPGKLGLLSSSVLYGLGGGVQRLISFILLPVFSHYLTPADYGVVGLLAALPAILLPIFSLGLSASIGVCYFASNEAEERLRLVQTAKFITTLSGLMLAVLALIFSDALTRLVLGNQDYRLHTLVAIATVSLSILCLPAQSEQQFSQRPMEYVSISLAGAVFTTLCSLLMTVFLELGALGMLLGGMSGQALVLVLLSSRKKCINQKKSKADPGLAKNLLTHGLPMLPSFFLLFIIQHWVRWPLENSHGIDSVGLFSLGSSLGASLTLITSGFVAAWMPWAMSHAEQWSEHRHVVAKRFTQYFITCGFVVLLFFCVAQTVTSLLLPSAFFDVWMTVGLAAASNFVMSLFSLVLPPVYIAKRVYLILISQTFAAIVTVIIFYSVRDFGFLGAALAVFVGVTALVFTQLIVNVKLTSVLPIPFDIWRLAIAVLILGFSCCATFFIGSLKGFQYFVFTGGVVLMAGAVMFFILPDRRCLLNGFADRMSKLLRRRRALNG